MPFFPTGIVTGGPYQPLNANLTAISALNSTGYARQTAFGAWTIDSTVPVSRGGTNFTSYAEGDLLTGNGSGTLSKLASPGVPGQVLVSGLGQPTWTAVNTFAVSSITGTANQVLANGNAGTSEQGAVTLTLPQDIATTSNVQFGTGNFNSSSPVILTLRGGGTAAQYQRFNTTGGNYYIGVESSAGTGLLPGVGAYGFAIVAESNRNIGIGVNNTLVGLFTATGMNSTAIGVSAAARGRFTRIEGVGAYDATDYKLDVTGTAAANGLLFRIGGVTAVSNGFTATLDAGASVLSFVMDGSLSTAAPSGSTARPWLLGDVNAVSPTAPNRTVAISVNGTVLYLHAKTTND